MKMSILTRNGLGIMVLMLSILLSGCEEKGKVFVPPVGGPCSYERLPGMLGVVSIKDGMYHLLFELRTLEDGRPTARTFVPLGQLDGWAIEVPVTDSRFAGAVLGDRFHADASVMTEGSCTPVIFEIGAKVGNSP